MLGIGKKKEKSKVKQTIFAIALALIFVFFVAYAIQTAYPEPDYSDYCKDIKDPYPQALTEEQCLGVNGTWTPLPKPDADGNSGYCDLWTNALNLTENNFRGLPHRQSDSL